MSTTFGIPIRLLEHTDTITDLDGELKDYISESFFIPIFFRSMRNSRWLDKLAHKLPDDTAVFALDNTRQGIYNIGDIKKLIENETNTQI